MTLEITEDWLVCRDLQTHIMVRRDNIAAIKCLEYTTEPLGFKKVVIDIFLIAPEEGETPHISFEFADGTTMWECQQALKKLVT